MTAQVTQHQRPAYAPDAWGYCIAVGVSIGVTWLALVVLTAFSDGDSDALLAVVVYGWLVVCALAVPSASIGVLLVHFSCRRVPQQWVHVLAAALTGFLTGLVFAFANGGTTDLAWGSLLGAIVGLATATGRAAVIPLVRRRQP